MMTLLITWILVLAVNAQQLDVHDLTNNNGYIPIKTGELKTINHYDKILHFINLKAYDKSMSAISDNINALKTITFEDKRLLETIDKDFTLLQAKINSLQIHSKSKRGLVNILGKGLKYIAGSMDSDDEKLINEAIIQIQDNERITNETLSELVHVNNFMTEQINNVTQHINNQQTHISSYINNFKRESMNRIQTLEDEVRFIEQAYRIDKDISFLKNHIDDIGQIIFSSKLGVIPTDILTKREIDLITDFDSYNNMKIVVILDDSNIILTLLIPQFSTNILSKIRFEPLPNAMNKSLILSQYEILVDNDNIIYDTNIKENLEKNLLKLENKCIENILKFQEAHCALETLKESLVIEIVPGVIILKNFNDKITHNCNKLDIRQKGTFLIKFENCRVNISNITYNNVNIKIHETFILPNLITEIKEKKNVTKLDLKLENLYIKQISHENNIELLMKKNEKINVISISTDAVILFIIILLTFIVISLVKYKQKLYLLRSKTENITHKKIDPYLQISVP